MRVLRQSVARFWFYAAAFAVCSGSFFGFAATGVAQDKGAAQRFHKQIEPILQTYCYGCHAEGEKKGGRAFDAYASDAELLSDIKLWHAVLKNVRSGVMPPPDEAKPDAAEKQRLFAWIERDVFHTNPAEPDPGRVTLRRLNRVEYRNTVRDLLGVEYDTTGEFPPDDAGYGFDNIGDAMSMSPLLVEKYLTAARAVVARGVPERPKQGGASSAAYGRIFVDGPPPKEKAEKALYARKILAPFVHRAYRRPVDDATVDRLVAIAQEIDAAPNQTFEAGVGAAIAAVLASPRFLYRVEDVDAKSRDGKYPLIDEFSLASRLSYFLWSTMPDDELLSLAEQHELRSNLDFQLKRMLKDPRSAALAANFAGQWLRSRDIGEWDIDAASVLGMQKRRDDLIGQLSRLRKERERLGELDAPPEDASPERRERWEKKERIRDELNRVRATADIFDFDLRRAMRKETEDYFSYVVQQDRDVLELVDSNYSFLNEVLAKHYGIPGVEGVAMRRVELPAGSPRGGVLTQGTVLAVTSNPNRTSPVKRGLFILDNILGSPPPPPPPPDVPLLEMAMTDITDHRPTVRELMEQHRKAPLCHACHARMDPLGLALENFNALGMWRDQENGQPIDASGTLLTGEKFEGIRQLKGIIKDEHRLDFYRCLTEKLLTYGLGRGLDYYDEYTVDQIVKQMDKGGGKFSTLLEGIVQSAAFQKTRRQDVGQ